MHRVAIGVVTALSAVCLGSAAAADTTGAVITDTRGADVSAGTREVQVGRGASGGTVVCDYRRLDLAETTPVYDLNGNAIEVDGTGQWYEKWCDTTFYGAVYISRANSADLLAEARRRLDLPLPQAQLSPAEEQLVNLATWLWINPASWAPRSATAAVPGISVTVTATPERAIWQMGDGYQVECSAGTPYDPTLAADQQSTDCLHVYTRSSAGEPGDAFTASATVRWQLSWSVSGGSGGGDLGTIDRTVDFPIAVAEVQALNVSAGGQP